MLLTDCSAGQEHQLRLGAYEKCKPSFPTPDLLTKSSALQLILPHNSVRSLPGPDWKSLFPLKLALSSLPEQKYSDLLQHWATKMWGTKGLGRKKLSLQNPLLNLRSFKGLWNRGIHATHFFHNEFVWSYNRNTDFCNKSRAVSFTHTAWGLRTKHAGKLSVWLGGGEL